MFELILTLNSPAFLLFGSPTTWAELLGAILGIAMVVCNIRQIHWGWPLACASSVLYFMVFWTSQLYGDASLQIFFAIMAAWGWSQWLLGVRADGQVLKIQTLSHKNTKNTIKLIAVCAFIWLVIGLFLLKFTTTDVPWWDAFPTALSIVATVLLGRKYIENWPLWILVNVVGMALFAYKGLWLTVVLYSLFAIMAIQGWRVWRKSMIAFDNIVDSKASL